MRRIFSDASNKDRVGASDTQWHRVLGRARVVQNDNTRCTAQNLAGFVWLHWSLEFDMDRLGVADSDRHAHAGSAHLQVWSVEDLACLVDHLLFFAVHAVGLVTANF